MASIFEATAGKLVGPTVGVSVTQATSKSTGVTANAASGQITMNNAALAAGAEVSFTVTCSEVSSSDVIIVNHARAGTAGAYLVQANNVTLSGGFFNITVANVSAGSLSEAIVLNFVALKGASS